MDNAVGVPKELAEKDREELTPMMTQYIDLCEEHDSELLLFHVGDFYKAFGEAAESVARICELNLTTREDNSGEYTMAGLRVENAETHLRKLLNAGYNIAIAEQVEDPELVSGVGDRKVTKVITPGTLTEEELLDSSENNYVMGLEKYPAGDSDNQEGDVYGVAYLDVSTGKFCTASIQSRSTLQDEISRVDPVEVIIGPELQSDDRLLGYLLANQECERTEFDQEAFREAAAREKFADYFGQLQASACDLPEVSAAGALLEYAEYTRGGGEKLSYITNITKLDPENYMQLDDVAILGLELFERRTEQSPEGSTLIDTVDKSVTALGSRKLREWIRRPLISEDRINDRLDAVEELLDNSLGRSRIRDLLQNVYDIERLSSKTARGRTDARDLRALHETLAVLPEILKELEEFDSDLLCRLHENLPTLSGCRSRIENSIREDPAPELTEGGIIKPGYNDELDELRETVKENKEWIEQLEETERQRTGIDNLSVGKTEVHGYYIEVTESNLDQVPDDYSRRQTLKRAERFYTPELKEREDEIVAAEQKANNLEYQLFREVRLAIGEKTAKLQELADQLARLDALTSYAEIAAFNDYSRPVIRPAGSGIEFEAGRHPVVEQTQEEFVPNGANLNREVHLGVITGPNMSGKSTYLRQVAIITLLAQAGSFVPADSASIGVVDQLFTRIGASDDITGGKSTFMMEMTEVAEILQNATPNSLVILDEVGRGTSTSDGFAIACAVCRHINESIGCYTLFATHHHELTEYIERFENARNLHFSAEQYEDEVVFNYTIQEGAATASYGVEVATEAGVPEPVIRDAYRVLEDEEPSVAKTGVPEKSNRTRSQQSQAVGRVLKDLLECHEPETVVDVINEIEAMELNRITPIEALNLLQELQRRLNASS